jgi:hypothetical protein
LTRVTPGDGTPCKVRSILRAQQHAQHSSRNLSYVEAPSDTVPRPSQQRLNILWYFERAI